MSGRYQNWIATNLAVSWSVFASNPGASAALIWYAKRFTSRERAIITPKSIAIM